MNHKDAFRVLCKGQGYSEANAFNRNRQALSASLLILSCLLATASAQTDKIDDYVKSQMDTQKIPGLSIAVVRHGEIVKAKGYGLANVELNVAAKPETVYQSGSMGKQFTATAVMMLVEEVTFVKDTSGRVTHLILHQGGDHEALRIK